MSPKLGNMTNVNGAREKGTSRVKAELSDIRSPRRAKVPKVSGNAPKDWRGRLITWKTTTASYSKEIDPDQVKMDRHK